MVKAKLKDVALDSGVSTATVSLVLSGKGKISKDVSSRVKESAQRLGYIRNPAQRIKRNSHRLIILTYVKMDWSYAWDLTTPIITKLEKMAVEKGYSLTIQPVTDNTTSDELYQMIIRHKTAGIASIHFVDNNLFSRLEKHDIPVVIINNSYSQNQFHSVCVDDFQGAYDGASYLMSLGHKNILYVEYLRPAESNVMIDRYIGFKKAADEHRIDFSDENRITVPFDDTEGFSELLSPFFTKPAVVRPTAIFAHDDRFAAVTMTILSKLGLSTPEDVSIIAPGDVLNYDMPYTPRITTMKIDSEMLGTVAGDHLIKIIKKQSDIYGFKVLQRLIDRGSCRSI